MGLPGNLKPVILCADDYAVTPAVSRGIRELAECRRLSAVSCMSTAPAWSEQAALLRPLRERIDVGLHFNLTLGFDRTVPGLASWLGSSLTGRIDRTLVERELLNQLECFEALWGEPPDFIDGHQHVHIFPGIRQPLLRLLSERYPAAQRPWVRRVSPALRGHDAPLKALSLRMLNAGLVRQARRRGIILTPAFAGLYSLSAQADYPAMMAGWLRRAVPGTLLMCHPSSSAEQDPDGIGEARLREFHYLRGQEFEDSLKREGVALVRFRC